MVLLGLFSLVEKQYSCSIKNLRTDNEGEYVRKEFQNFCKEHGILHQHYVPYIPKKNGVVKRKNRRLKEMAICMIHYKNLASTFWAKKLIVLIKFKT